MQDTHNNFGDNLPVNPLSSATRIERVGTGHRGANSPTADVVQTTHNLEGLDFFGSRRQRVLNLLFYNWCFCMACSVFLIGKSAYNWSNMNVQAEKTKEAQKTKHAKTYIFTANGTK